MQHKPCAYEDHEPSYWRVVGQEIRVCGVCHPIPLPLCCRLDTREEGFWTRKEGFVAVEYPEPEPIVKEKIVVEKLRRPKTKFEADMFAKDLGAALDRLGVDRGAEFVFTAAENEEGVAVIAAVEQKASQKDPSRQGSFQTQKGPESAITGG